MARMYPQSPALDTTSQAELALFESIAAGLSDEHYVFHSACFQLPSRLGPIRDGEADFLVVHPERGVLVLEVKGGQIVHNRKRGEWISIARGGERHVIKDPLNQAKTAMYRFRELWDSVTNTAPTPIFGHAVAFPDTSIPPDAQAGPDLPRAILMDQGDAARPADWFESAYAYYRGQGQAPPPPSADHLRAFLRQLGGTRHFRPAMWGSIQQEKARMARLTEQQFLLLDALGRRRRALVAGCAGSGKTMLAVEKAARLAEAGHRTLLTCYNKALARFLRQRLGPRDNLTVQHFHELAHELATRAGTLPERPDYGSGNFYDEVLPEALLSAIAAQPETRYDAIVVDEGQDFSETWWVPLSELLEHPDEDIFYIFYDQHQQLYGRQTLLPLEGEPFLLSANCRNTRPIHRLVMRFGGDWAELARSVGADGRPVVVEDYGPTTAEALAETAGKVVEQLVDREQVPVEHIVLLSPFARTSGKSLLAGIDRIGRFPLTESDAGPEGCLRFSTIHGFKGCEADVALLIEADRWKPGKGRDALLYVACSRARHHLVVLLPEGQAGELRQALRAGR